MRPRTGLHLPTLLALAVLCLLTLAVFLASRKAKPDLKAQVKTASTEGQPTVPVVQTPAKRSDTPGPLPNLDLRVNGTGSEALLPLPRINALAKLKQMFPGLAVEFDPITKSPKWIGSNAGLLSASQPGLAAKDADAPIRQFIEANREIFGHGAERLDSARRVTDYSTSRSGSRKVVWHQQLDGIDIFEAVFQANLTANSELINLGSHLVADPEAAAGDPNRANLLAAPPIAVEDAVAVAGQNVGERVTTASVKPMGPPAAQADRRQTFRAAMLTDAEAKLIWVPMDAVTLRLAWDVTVSSRTRAEMYRVLVDAKTGGVLVRQALTAYISDASYRVYTTESPTPFSPGHQSPSSLQPAAGSRVLLTTPAMNTTASPNGWINDGDNITSGNNTDTYTDANADNVADTPRTQGSPLRTFDFPINFTQEPATYKDASVTQLFYWTNFAHDRLYDLGFTEAAGNFQINNFGRGGAANDPVNAEAQDGSGTNNANFSTPVDGGRGRMQMFLWTGPTPDRDGSFEAEVVLHEYCHGLSNRLVGGPSVTISALSSQGMGEGWSDFYGLALTAEASDNPHGNWARAGYSRYLTSGWLSENYYYGARRYSYSTDMLKNPHTFKDIDPTQVDWHTSVPRNPTYGATQDATQVHYVGTVWCTMLWDLRANLILKHGFATGNERAMFLVAEGMKLGPANPNLVQSRDGIIQAALVNHPADLGEVWTAFAKRGMGFGATAPVSTTTTGLTESYSVPDSLEIHNRSGWNITGNKGGPFTPATQALALSNDGASSLIWSVNTNAAWLSASPTGGTLAPGATIAVTLTTQANATVPGFHSANVVFTNATSGFNQPIGVRLNVIPPVAQAFDLSTNPGWTTTGEWAYGTPAGSGGASSGGSGNADPTTGATGANVFGVNLAGNHTTAVSGPFYLTSPPINLSARKNTRLRFQRWLNTNALANTRVTVEISRDGTTWREVFVNPGAAITDNAWTLMDYDISSIADQQAAVQVRWSYRTISSPGSYSGWNIDDVQFLGEPTAQFSLDIAASTSESAAPFNGTLSLNIAQPNPITVTLSSSEPTAATVPASITLTPGQVSKTFTITPVADSALDGTQVTVIGATAPSIASVSKELQVTDDETATLTLTTPANVTEGQASISGSVSVSSPPTRDVQIQLSSNHAALALPVGLTIPSGSTGPVSFTFFAPDNAFAEGAKNVMLTASLAGWSSGTANVSVADDETPTILLTGPSSAREGDGPQTFTATVNTVQAANLTLNLSSNDATELTVPATVMILAGQFSATFDAAIVNDAQIDGTQSATITTSASGYPDAIRTVNIADNEVHHYTFAAIASPQKRNQAIGIAVTARDLNGETITNHSGSLALTSISPEGPVPFAPASLNGFSNGAAAGLITVTTTATAVRLTAEDSNGKTGLSNAFDVEPVLHDTFTWSGLPVGTVFLDTLFSGTATARDDQGNISTSYNSPTVIEAHMPVFDRTVNSGAAATAKVFNTASHDSRVQLIYTAEEMGGTASWLGAMQFSLATVGGQPMQNFTLRLKHTNRANFDGASWEEGEWTTVYTNSSLSSSGTLFTAITPFYFNGIQNVMLDVSFNNSTASTAGTVRYLATATNRVLSGTSNSLHGDPLTWTAATGPAPVISNELPTLLTYVARNYGPIPASPVTFANGQNTMQAFAPTASNLVVWLRATAPSGVSGFSPKVSISSTSASVGATTIFSDGFETGTLGSSWNVTGNSGATARTQVVTTDTPKTGAYHLTMDTTSAATGTFARNSPTLTLNLAGRTNVSLEWFAKEFSDENFVPALTGPSGTFDSTANYDGVAISQDGTTWVEISSLINLSSAYGSTVTRIYLDPVIQRLGWNYNSTFRLRFSQYDDQALPNDGIAIDDVVVRANPTNAIALSLPPTIAEGTLNVPVTVTFATAPASNTTVNLSSIAPARLTITSPVTVLAGQTTATTTISAPQNQFADIGKDITITASATGQTTSFSHIRVVDDERPVLSVLLPPSITEGGSSASGTVSMSPFSPVATPVFFTSGDTTKATVSSNAIIGAGSSSTSFVVVPGNDTLLDGTRTITITASGDGLTTGEGTINVLDNENPQIVLTPPPAPIREGGAPGVGTISISAQRPMITTVNMTSSDLTEATVAASVVIPAGQTTVNYQVFPVDDAEQDGTQSVSLTASAAGLTSATTSVQVVDNDPSFFEISTITSPRVRNAAIPVTITATDDSGLTLSTFNGTATLSAEAGATHLPVTPAGVITFANGIWTGNVSIGAAANGVTLTATGSDGATGTSNVFNVSAGGSATGLVFTPITSPQQADSLIPVQLYSADANGILVNEVNGPVTVELVRVSSGAVLATVNLTLLNGAASTTISLPAAMPSVFLRATVGSLTGQSSNFAITSVPLLAQPPPEVLFVDDFESGAFKPQWTISGTSTHRTIITTAQTPRGLSHMVMDSSAATLFARNEATLTLNLAGKSDVVLSFWMKEFLDEDHGPPATPFTNGADFDGVAISADGVTWYEVQSLRGASVTTSYQQFSLNLNTLAAARGLNLNSSFKVRFNHYDDNVAATDGFAFDDIRVTANAFAPLEPVQAVFQDDFESAGFRPEWSITGTASHRTVITTEQAPRGQYHLVMDASPAVSSRNEATLTLNLTGWKELNLKFWMKENSDEDQAPATNPFTGGADFDGVAISADGTTWYEVQALRGTASTNTYQEFTIDLDAVLAARGLTYNSQFRIRFNHFDNSPWPSGDGFAFDDISIIGQPLNTLTVVAPTSLTEGATATAHVAISTPRATDTVVSLTTNRPAGLSLPATVIIPAGATTSANFSLTALENAYLTSSLPAQILATANGLRRGAADLALIDNEAPVSFTLTLPGTLVEGGSIAGSVALSPAPIFDLPISLSALPAYGLTLSASVTVTAGTTSAAFNLAKPENTAVLEPASSIVTAAVGATSASKTVTLTDNDTAGSLVLNLPASIQESAAPGTGTVGLTSPKVAGKDIVVSLANSGPSSLAVPATVTILAGQAAASFAVSPVDNALQDGARGLTVTASASGLTGIARNITVHDEELHHLAIDPVASPQMALQAFNLVVRALTIDSQPAAITGTASLSAASGVTPVSINPTTTAAFVSGVATTSVTFSSSASNVIITASAAGGMTAISNAFNIELGSRLGISPGTLVVNLPLGEPLAERALTLTNAGTAAANWSAVVVYPGASPAPPPLASILSALNSNIASINSIIPNRYDFTEGVTGNSIGDGGDDMYDTGNYLGTNITPGVTLNYSDNVISAATNLGSGGQYFTRKHPGLFVLAADVTGLNYFEISGGLGADSAGSTDTTVLTSVRAGVTFKGFVKRVWASSDPSVNHLIIIQDNGTAAQDAATDTDSDYHRLNGLTGVTRIYYLLYASPAGGYISNTQTQAIMDAFLNTLVAPAWLTVTPSSGSVPAGGSSGATAILNPSGLPLGTYSAALRFTSNDPTALVQDLPVTFNIAPAVDHFQWSTVPSSQTASVVFPATVTARDATNALSVSFNGFARLSALGPLAETITGAGTGTSNYPLDGSYYETRTQTIYTPVEVGSAGRIQSIALNIATMPATIENFTIRLKHTTKANYAGAGNAVWETDDWTTVYRGTLAISATGWFTLPLTTLFDYNGSGNLMVDMSFDTAFGASSGAVRATTVETARSLVAGAFGSNGDPLAWIGSTPAGASTATIPNLRFAKRAVGSVSPSVVTFTNGSWSGNTSVLTAGTTLVLNAVETTKSAVTGDSNAFNVTAIGSLALAVSGSGPEGGLVNATVSANVAPASDLVISLASSDVSEATVPATVNILAGQTSASFSVTLVDDTGLDGPQSLVLSATTPAYTAANASLIVTDNDSTTVTVTLPASVSENAAAMPAGGSVTLGVAAAANLTIGLVSSDTTELTVPASITIAAGQTTATFSLTPVNDALVDASQSVTVTATLVGSTPGAATMSVTDDEARTLSVGLYLSSRSESSGTTTAAGFVSLAGTATSNVSVTIASNDTTELLATSVTIPSGSSSANFSLTAVNDSLLDGTQTVTLTASAATFTNGTNTISITDDDVHNFLVSAIPSSQVRHAPFNVTFTARDINNATITGYSGSPVLTATNGGTPLAKIPATVTGFSSGQKVQSITIQDFAANAVLTLADPVTGGSGSSNAFAVGSGPHSAFVWNSIPSPQHPGTAFPVTITAQDAQGNVAASFTGTATLEGIMPAGEVTSGSGMVTSSKPLDTGSEGSRSQILYTSSEVGGAKLLTGIALDVSSLPGLPLTRFGIRLKHASTASYSGSPNFDNSSLTLVYQRASQTISTTGWNLFQFDTPFNYNGTQNLLVDLVFDNSATATAGICRSTTTSPSRQLYAGNMKAWGYGDPYNWVGGNTFSSSSLPNMKFSNGAIVPLTPSATGSFSAGVWSGNIVVPDLHTGLWLRAVNAGLSGNSNTFDVMVSGPILVAEPPFTGGTSNEVSWSGPPVGMEVEIQRDNSPAFAAPVTSPWTLTSSHTFGGLTDGALYFYRARGRSTGAPPLVESPWSNIVSSTQDAMPPLLTAQELTAANASAVLTGTALDAVSGVASVVVSGAGATSGTGFATWNHNVSGLTNGTNTIGVSASDNAVPPNTSTITALIYRIANAGSDPAQNGINALAEHAFGIPADATNPRSLLPAATTQTDIGTGQRFLTLDYRRRLQREGLQYLVETSDNLTSWSSTGADVIEQSVTPNADGLTETVRVRVTPAMTLKNAKFVRLRVVIQ